MKDRSASYRYASADGMTASNLLEFLAQGGEDETSMRELAAALLDYVRARKDCADFRAAYLVRVLYSFGERIPPDLYDEIASALLGFPYEDCGGHGMCTWTENHRLYAAGTEYLLAQMFPEAAFGDGRGHDHHLRHAEEELRAGLGEIVKYGFSEWGSNNYYSETMAGLANLVQFARDDDIRGSAREALLMMTYEILSQSFFSDGYVFGPACARAYADNKTSSDIGSYVEPQTMAMRGEDVRRFKEKEGCMILLLRARLADGTPFFAIPEAWIGLPDTDGREIALMQGVDIAEYGREGLAAYSPRSVRYAFKAGAISDWRVICRSMRYLRETGLCENGMLKALKPFAHPFFYRTGLLRILKRMIPSGFDGAAMEKGRVYTYACRDYSVSAAFDYRVGQVLFQQNSLAVNLSYKISLFATEPYAGPEKTGFPGYWVGSARAPRAAAYRNLALCIFELRRVKKECRYTHLFFPVGLFDETDLSRTDEGILFGRAGRVNVCVRTNPGVSFVPAEESAARDRAMFGDGKVPAGYFAGEYDLINRAKGLHYYVFEVDDRTDFAEFREKAAKRRLAVSEKDGTVSYGLYDCRLAYGGAFTVGGREFSPDFRRPRDVIGETV
jgi:hypothetical protein